MMMRHPLRFYMIDDLPPTPHADAVFYLLDQDGKHARHAIVDTQGSVRLIGRDLMTSDRTYHVSPAGSDVTGDGSVSKPWRSIWYAWLWISGNIDLGGYILTIQLAPGAYAGGFSCYGPLDTSPYDSFNYRIYPSGCGAITVQGDPDAPQDYIVTSRVRTDGTCFDLTPNASVQISFVGMWLKSLVDGEHGGVSNWGGNVFISKCIIGDASGPGFFYALWGTNGRIDIADCEFRGSSSVMIYADYGCISYALRNTVADVSVSDAAIVSHGGYVGLYEEWTGTVTGKKAIVRANGLFQNASYINATIALTQETGGQLV